MMIIFSKLIIFSNNLTILMSKDTNSSSFQQIIL